VVEGQALYLKKGKVLNKNRDRLDIVNEVLTIAQIKMRKTRIMYRANLSYVQAEKYLAVLLGSGLLAHDGDYSYLITERGKEFLQLYNNYLAESANLMGEVERNLGFRLRLETMCFSDKK
jgi:predicted transcriptional regulator